MGQRTAIVGDVHGMRDELARLLSALALRPGDRLVSVGDLVRKGPDTPGVFALLRGERERGVRVDFVLGNHELKLRRAQLVPTGEDAATHALLLELHPSDRAAILGAPLHLAIDEPGGPGVTVLHGGVLPGWSDLPPADAHEAFAVDARRADAIVRLRHVTGGPRRRVKIRGAGGPWEGTRLHPADAPLPAAPPGGSVDAGEKVIPPGAFVRLGEHGPDDPYWAEVYDGRFGHIYSGHQPFLEYDVPVRFPHATVLDLGCVYGGRLAAVVREGGREVDTVVVRAERGYEEYRTL